MTTPLDTQNAPQSVSQDAAQNMGQNVDPQAVLRQSYQGPSPIVSAAKGGVALAAVLAALTATVAHWRGYKLTENRWTQAFTVTAALAGGMLGFHMGSRAATNGLQQFQTAQDAVRQVQAEKHMLQAEHDTLRKTWVHKEAERMKAKDEQATHTGAQRGA